MSELSETSRGKSPRGKTFEPKIEDGHLHDTNNQAEGEKKWFGKSPERLRRTIDWLLNRFVSKTEINGVENIDKIPVDKPLVIATSHASNLDFPLIIKTLGERMNPQITHASFHLNPGQPQRLRYKIAGKESFSAIDSPSGESEANQMFNPRDFDELRRVVLEEGKVPIIAALSTVEEEDIDKFKISDQANGAAYLAASLDATVLPIGINVEGAGKFVNTRSDIVKALLRKLKAKVSIGEPIYPGKLDTDPIRILLEKRKEGLPVSGLERERFTDARKTLKQNADLIRSSIGNLVEPVM